MSKGKSPQIRFTPTPKADLALRLLMQKYGYTRKGDALNSALIDRASHISKEARQRLEAENEAHDTLAVTALKTQVAELQESVAGLNTLIQRYFSGGDNGQA
jgi:hypothetical protein